MKINNKTKIIISASNTPGNFGSTIYNEIFRQKKMNYIYFPIKISDEKDVLKAIKIFNLSGCSISMPLKEKVFKFVKSGNLITKKSKSINTILVKNKKLIGFNTDIFGAYEVLKKINFKNALIFGSGGVSRSIILSLKFLKKNIFICSRNKLKLSKISKEFKINIKTKSHTKFDLIINATPVKKMKTFCKYIPLKTILSSKTFMDLNVLSKKNQIQKKLFGKKIKFIPGEEMSKYQLQKQFFIYTGKNVSIKDINKILITKL